MENNQLYEKDNHILRRLRADDINNMLEWMHDPTINKYYRNDFSKMTEELVAKFIANSFDEVNQHFAFVNDKDEYLGTISLKNISQKDKNAEYSIATRKCAQGTGITYLATKELLGYAFDSLGLHRVYLNVLEDNFRANAFYKKCGFVFEGCFREHLFLDGEFKNLNWYGITREDQKLF